jgi:hypothetical protein
MQLNNLSSANLLQCKQPFLFFASNSTLFCYKLNALKNNLELQSKLVLGFQITCYEAAESAVVIIGVNEAVLVKVKSYSEIDKGTISNLKIDKK